MSGSAEKASLRQAAFAARDALDPHLRQAAAETIAARGIPVAVPPGAVVSGFMPIGSEINPLPLMKRLEAAGAHLALPSVVGRGKPLEMRAWSFGAKLTTEVWGIRVPPKGSPILDPDILLVPLAVFDRSGERIGYGAGYYDRTIERLRGLKPVTAIGLAFAAQEIAHVPATPHDQRLDFVMTERETIKIARPAP